MHRPALSHSSQGAIPLASPSASSLASSLSSSAASSMLHPAAPSSSSQSDIVISDHSSAAPLPPPASLKPLQQSAPPVIPPPRSPSPPSTMGQTPSRASASAAAASKSFGLSNTAAAAGQKLRRAFIGRRKRHDDASSSTSSLSRPQNKGSTGRDDFDVIPSPLPPAPPSPSRSQTGGKDSPLTMVSNVFRPKRRSTSSAMPSPMDDSSPPPPPLPPKPPALRTPRTSNDHESGLKAEHRTSVILTSPGISAAVQFIQSDGQSPITDSPSPTEGAEPKKETVGSRRREPEKQSVEAKDVWRKSDSTISHYTVRPGATVGSRTSRPVSMAESFQSTHTVVPMNHRLSALLTDADFVTPEEEDGSQSEEEDAPVPEVKAPLPLPVEKAASPASATKSRNRRSLSLNLGPTSNFKTKPPMSGMAHVSASEDDLLRASVARSRSDSVSVSPTFSPKATQTLTRAEVSGIISSMPPTDALRPTSRAMKRHLPSMSASQSNAPPSAYIPPAPPSAPLSSLSSKSASPRKPAISITGFAPAAGLARRAVERMGRAWGGMGSHSHTVANGNSSSSSTLATASSRSSNKKHDHNIYRSDSEQSGASSTNLPNKLKSRRTPNAPSGAWSITSSGTNGSSHADADAPVVPPLGRRLRGPLRLGASGAGLGCVVFGRDLQSCVSDTAVWIEAPDFQGSDHGEHGTDVGLAPQDEVSRAVPAKMDISREELESRMLPALVVRCAEHIMTWGLQEEGLFRINGRPAHVARIRAEFDTGADYDLAQCGPGDLDPHAVSSVFKAYLRELPEPILTHALIPYFDAAMSAENDAVNNSQPPSSPRSIALQRASRGPGLPSGPRSGMPAMRKPPSLSTLAMPNLSNLRPPSESLLNALSSLIARLPPPNRDVLRTVTELVKATDRNRKETKMPLTNLLLVLCPTLNMSPSLLRMLCEAEGIWDGPRRSSMDSSRASSERERSDEARELRHDDDDEDEEGDEDSVSDADDQNDGGLDVDKQSVFVDEDGLPRFRHPAGPRTMSRDRATSTVYLDAVDHIDVPLTTAPTSGPSSETGSVQDSDSYISTSEGPLSTSPSNSSRLRHPHSPLDLSSTESLPTPASSSPNRSFSLVPKPEEPYAKPSSLAHSPIIASLSDDSLPVTPRRPHVVHPMPYSIPSTTPSSPVSRRKSIPFLSAPSTVGYTNPTQSTPTLSRPMSVSAMRTKKPSLHLIFSPKSQSIKPSMISAPYLHPPGTRLTGSSSESTPISASSMVTAPQSSSFSLCPQLDTAIDSSPLEFGLELSGKGDVPATETPTQAGDTSSSVQLQDEPAFSLLSKAVPEVVRSEAPVDSEPVVVDHADAPCSDREEEAWARRVLAAADSGLAWLSGSGQ